MDEVEKRADEEEFNVDLNNELAEGGVKNLSDEDEPGEVNDEEEKKSQHESVRDINNFREEKASQANSHTSRMRNTELNQRTDFKHFTKEPTLEQSAKVNREGFVRENTLGLGSTLQEDELPAMLQKIKAHKDRAEKLLRLYREIDQKEYENFIKLKVTSKKVKKVLVQFYMLNHGFAECALVYLMNSYDETGISRLFQAFYLEFDKDNNMKMDSEELENCIEVLAQENYIGREKMVATLAQIGVDCQNNLSFFQEGGAAKKLLDNASATELFRMLKYDEGKKKLDKKYEHVDFYKFVSLVAVFFLEYMTKLFLKKRAAYEQHLGFPYIVMNDGKQKIDKRGEPFGLFRAFVSQLKGVSDVKNPILTFRTVSKALIAYRSSGFTETFSMEALERIMKKVKEMMDVDPVSGTENKKLCMKELLPYVASRIATEITWATTKFRRSIEKYDHLVNWHGGALCLGLRKKKLDEMLEKAFYYNKFPTFDQFVKGLDFILKTIIPSFDSPAAIFVAKKILKTPDAVVAESNFDEGTNEIRLRIDINYLINEDDMFVRLYNFSSKFQLKLMFVRLLYKNRYLEYKRHKKINKTINELNKILENNSLFPEVPGKLGYFERKDHKMMKIDDEEEMKKELELRKEIKKKKFLESLLNSEPEPSRESKKNIEKKGLVVKQELKINDSLRNEVIEKQNEKLRTIKLQAEANEIDRRMSERESEGFKRKRRTKESSAYPNSKFITPNMVMSLIQASNTSDEKIKRLEEYIYAEKETINYQDIYKFLLNEDLKESVGESYFLDVCKTKYEIRDFREIENIEEEEVDDEALEELMFEEVNTETGLKSEERVELVSNMKIKPQKIERLLNFKSADANVAEESEFKEKDRGCGCLIA
jgi:hypothetical protein